MFNNISSNDSSNGPFTQYQHISNTDYYSKEVRCIIKKARQNERYRLPLHVNHYKNRADIRPYLHLFAGIGVEKLYLFYTHVLYLLDIHGVSNGLRQYYPSHKYLCEDMLTMVTDPLFRRKLHKLEEFSEDEFRTIDNTIAGGMVSIIKEGQEYFDFDRKQLLYFLLDITLNSLQHFPAEEAKNQKAITIDDNSRPFKRLLERQIYRGNCSKENRLRALKTVYARKVKTQNADTKNDTNNDTNVGNESFLYELNLEKLRDHEDMARRGKLFKGKVIRKMESIKKVDAEIQTQVEVEQTN